jgi:hypothetical protein
MDGAGTPRATPETTHPTRGPHQQLSETAPRDLQEESLRRVHTLPDVEVGWSAISVPYSRGFHLKPHAAKRPAKALQRGSEFGHLHPEYDGKERIRLRPARQYRLHAGAALRGALSQRGQEVGPSDVPDRRARTFPLAARTLLLRSGRAEPPPDRSTSQIGKLPQPTPARIRACFVALSPTRQVPGDNTPKSRPSVSGDGSGTTIWRWSAISAAVTGTPLRERVARGCVAAATAARGTNNSDSSSMRGSGMSAAVIARMHRPSRSATIAAPSGAVQVHTLTEG